MNVRNLILSLVVAMLTLLSSTRAHADCTDNGTNCSGVVGAIMGPVDGAQLAGGLITMIGGAVDLSRHHASRGWRIANYVLGSLNLVSGLALTGFSIAVGDTGYFSGFAGSHLAIGGADLTVAIISSRHAAESMALRIRPLSGKDSTGHLMAGLGLELFSF
jgi:hypothetical protein